MWLSKGDLVMYTHRQRFRQTNMFLRLRGEAKIARGATLARARDMRRKTQEIETDNRGSTVMSCLIGCIIEARHSNLAVCWRKGILEL